MAKRREHRHLQLCERLQKGFGERLKSAREARGEMQKTLANGMGLSRTTISNIERGLQRIYLDQAFQAAALLDIAVIELLPPMESVIKEPTILVVADDRLSIEAEIEVARVSDAVRSRPRSAMKTKRFSSRKPTKRRR